jgi:hypothetical protein
MINPNAVFSLPKNNAALILLRETQKQVRARSCANGWALVNGEFVHHSKAKFIRKLEEA